MKMTLAEIDKQLSDLKERQEKVENAWDQTGNRGLIAFFVEVIPELLDCERCSIFVLDPTRKSVWVQCGTGVNEREIEVPADDSLVGEVISTGKPVIRTHLDNKIGTHAQVDRATAFITSNILSVPVFSANGEHVTGAIQVLNKRWNRDYSEEDLKWLERFAVQLQSNIDNIYLRQEWGRFSIIARKKIAELEAIKLRLEGGPIVRPGEDDF